MPGGGANSQGLGKDGAPLGKKNFWKIRRQRKNNHNINSSSVIPAAATGGRKENIKRAID